MRANQIRTHEIKFNVERVRGANATVTAAIPTAAYSVCSLTPPFRSLLLKGTGAHRWARAARVRRLLQFRQQECGGTSCVSSSLDGWAAALTFICSCEKPCKCLVQLRGG